MKDKSFPMVTTVKGISEKRRMPRRDKIRLGIKVKSGKGKEYPKEVDYFVCPEEVQKEFGEKPKRLEIMFPVNDREQVFPQAYTWYGKSKGVLCKGNGEEAYRYDEKAGVFVPRECPCELLEQEKGGCSLRGHLMFMIPRVNMGWVYQMDTSSYHSIVDINSGIEYIEELVGLATGTKRFALVPLIIERIPRKTGGGDTGVLQTHYTISLFAELSEDKLNQIGNRIASTHASNIALPLPEDINPEHDNQPAIEITCDKDDCKTEELIEDKDKESLDDKPETKSDDKKENEHIKREMTTKINIDGDSLFTAGIKAEQVEKIFEYKDRGKDEVNNLKKYFKEISISKISELTENEAKDFINSIDNKNSDTEDNNNEGEDLTFGDEESHLNKKFWAIINEMGIERDLHGKVKKMFYNFCGPEIKSLKMLSIDQWLYVIDLLNEYKKDIPSFLITVKSIKE